jgi:hypothetical protein
MSRIIEETHITRVLEAVSPETNIYWNPVDDTGNIVFRVKDMLTENDVFKGLQSNQSLGTGGQGSDIWVTIENLLNRTITIILPDQSTMDIPSGILMLAVTKLFNDLYDERIVEMNNWPY